MRKRIALFTLAAAVTGTGAAAQTTPDTARTVTLSLSQAVALASDTAPAVRLAEIRTAEAQERVRQAQGALLPTVGAAASGLEQTRNLKTFGLSFPSAPGAPTIPDKIGPFETYDARLRASAPVWDPASRVRVQASRSLVQGTQADRDAAAQTAGQRAAVAYLRAARAQALLAARAEDVRLAGELVSLARQQLERGVAAGIDVTRAQTQLVSARSLQSVARNQYDQAELELARALGVDPATQFRLTDALSPTVASPTVSTNEAQAVQAGVASRPELRAERARLQAAQLATRALRAERLPRLEVVADYGWSGGDIVGAFPTYDVGVQVSMPVFDGFRREARTREQELVAQEAGVREADLQQQVATEVRSALLDVANGLDQQAIARERLQLANEELAQAQERFANGIAGNIEVINAQQSLLRARDAVIDAQFATAAARVSLARATGTTQTIQ